VRILLGIFNSGGSGECLVFGQESAVGSVSATDCFGTFFFIHKRSKCDNGDGGCDGGDLPTAFAYVEANGLESEASYPYAPSDDTCGFNRSRVVATISGFQYATATANETQMQVAMYTKGPLSVCVDASTWQFYTGGVMTNNCGQSLDHCVQITGWSVDNTQNPPAPYWIVRNSWSSNWGIRGYIFVERNSDLCGIANEATYATI